MKKLFGIGILALMTTTVGADGPSSTDAGNAFARLRTLAGEWDASIADGETAHLSIELIAAGSALLERETGGNRPVMTTMYHRDGDRLLLTHYCMAGNQPRMQARPYDESKHELTFEFVDATHLETTWQFYENRKPTMTERATYTRVR